MASVKLAFTSDLYFPVTPADKLREVARQMAAFSPDTAILAGDLAESLADFTRVLQLFRGELACPIRVLPGDVDFWARPPYDSRRLWTELLPKAVRDAGCDWLEGQTYLHGGLAVTGSVAWYDYSCSPMAGMVTDMEFAQNKYLHNADALRIDWEWTDPEFAGQVGSGLLATLARLEQDDAVRAVVVATHFPILEPQLVRKPGMGYTSAYAGNLTLGRKVLGHGKLRHVVSGHAHVGRRADVSRRDGQPPVEAHVVASDYDKPGWLGLTV